MYEWFLNRYPFFNELRKEEMLERIQSYVGSSVFRMAILDVSYELKVNVDRMYDETNWSQSDDFENDLMIELRKLY